MGHFLSFHPLDNPENKMLKNWKKHLEILSFYTRALLMAIIWCIIPEIWSTTDIIFCHFEMFFVLLPPMDQENQNFEKLKKHIWRYYHSTHIIWCMVRNATDRICCATLDHLCPLLLPPNNLKNYVQMMYRSWDTIRKGCNFYFSPSLPPLTKKWTDGRTEGETDGETEKVTCRGRCLT